MRFLGFIVCFWVVVLLPFRGVGQAALTFQELMDPAIFPEAQRGMAVISTREANDGDVEVVTTGAIFLIHSQTGDIIGRQRIGQEREVAVLHIGHSLEGLRITHSSPGFVRVISDNPRLVIRINGDSLMMLRQDLFELRIAKPQVFGRCHPGW